MAKKKLQDWDRADLYHEFLEETHFKLSKYRTTSTGNKQLDNSILIKVGAWDGSKDIKYTRFKPPRHIKSSTGKDLDQTHLLQLRARNVLNASREAKV